MEVEVKRGVEEQGDRRGGVRGKRGGVRDMSAERWC